MRLDPVKHWEMITQLPGIITAPANACHGVTDAPDDRPLILVDLEWADGHHETGRGCARAWTRQAVYVDVDTSRGHYLAWVPASTVRRQP